MLVGFAILAGGLAISLRGFFLAGCLSVLLLACVFNYHLIRFDAGPVNLTLDRIAVVGLGAAFLVACRRGRATLLPSGHADWILLALVAYLTVSTFAGNWRGAPGHVAPYWRLFAGYLVPAALYWTLRGAPLGERATTFLPIALASFGLCLAVSGILEVHERWDWVFPSHVADPGIGNHFGRARGPMLQSVSYCLYLGVGLACLWLLMLRKEPRIRNLLLVTLPLMLAATLFTYTRTAYLAIGLGGIAICALTLTPIWRKATATAVIVGLLGLAFVHQGLLSFQRGPAERFRVAQAAEAPLDLPGAAGAANTPKGVSPFATPVDEAPTASGGPRGRDYESSMATRYSAFQRIGFAYVSWVMFLDRPWLGFGFGQFPTAKLAYLNDDPFDLELDRLARHAHHNQFLSVLTETGLVGLTLFLALLGSWALTGWRLWRSEALPHRIRDPGALLLASFAVYLPAWGFFELSFSPTDHGLLFVLAGVAANLERTHSAGVRHPLVKGPPAPASTADATAHGASSVSVPPPPAVSSRASRSERPHRTG